MKKQKLSKGPRDSRPLTDAAPETPTIAGYLCELIASGIGDRSEFFLDGYVTETPQAAIRWLRKRAIRLANAVDPCPGEGWATGQRVKALRPLQQKQESDPDPGWVLRQWCSDSENYRNAVHELRETDSFSLTVHDYTTTLTFAIRQVTVICAPL